MKKLKMNSLIAILLITFIGLSSQQMALAEEADMKSNAGISFENNYEASSSAPEELPDTNTPVLVEKPIAKETTNSKVLPQTGEIVGSIMSWIGVMMILVMIIIRIRKKTK
ncbi:LPXTG cell wall anchor domain-containing protein [Enterococcus rotai]|uniref:LPXTG cell wall anchor domain-containing protein n=1 Tax=Enterococcus rotai TaxID=118060 RepID=UPI0035C6A6B9